MALGATVRDALLNWFRGTAFGAAPSTIYLAAFTAAPNAGGGGTEVSGSGYTRVAFTFGAPSSGSESNGSQIVFPTATGSQGTITHIAIMDAASAGTLLAFAALSASKTIGSGARLVFDIAQLSHSVT